MSHTTEIDDVVISDIKALEAAIAELNAKGARCQLIKNAAPRAFYENQKGLEKTDYVIRLADSRYDVGLYKVPGKAGYRARADMFAGDVARVLGCGCSTDFIGIDPSPQESRLMLGKLYQTYAIHAAIRSSVAKGYTVRRVDNKDGSVRLVVTGM